MISSQCPLILPSHILIDEAKREVIRKKCNRNHWQGIGPVYEDKVSRRALHLMDLFEKDLFNSKLTSLTAYHNFLLEELYKSDGTDLEHTHKEWMGHFSKIKDLVIDSSKELNNLG